MRCAICRIQIDSVDEAVKQGWIPFGEEYAEYMRRTGKWVLRIRSY